MLFLAMMIAEKDNDKGEVYMCIAVAIIAVLNMVYGFEDAWKPAAGADTNS
jgi:hypothetical protein